MQGARLLALTSLLVVVWRLCPLKAGIVVGDSMQPTLRNGQLFLLDRLYYRSHAVTRGDIVVLRHEGETLLKRVLAVPGDVVWELRTPGDPSIVVREEARLRLAAATRAAPGCGNLVPLRVPPGCVYVLGDAADVSYDSRDFGPVPAASIGGRVFRP